MDIQTFFKTTIENTAKAVVSALKNGLFSVEVKNLPKVTEISGKVNVLNLKDIEVSYQKIKEMFDDLKKNLPTTVKVENFPEFPEFPNFPEPEKFPDKIKTEVTNEITVKEFKQLVGLTANISKKLDELPKEFPKFPKFPEFPKIPAPIVKVEEKDFPTEIEISNLETLISKNPKAYIPVRLTDGEDFYESMARSFGGAVIEPYSDSEGLTQKALVDKQRHLQVDVLTMPEIVIPPVTGGATEAKQDDTITAIRNIEIPLVDVSALAKESKQLPDGHEVEVNNFPATFPLPASQITTLTPPTTITVANPTTNPETGLAKSTKQDSQITLETTLNTLVETLQELTTRLTAISATVANTQQLRVVQASVPSTAVTGPITSAQSIAEKNAGGVSYAEKMALDNLTAIQSNVNNCIGK